jgi:hypothetical protein
MKSELTTEDVKEMTQELYRAFMTPKFIFNKIINIRKFNDIKFLGRAARKLLGHLMDFKR